MSVAASRRAGDDVITTRLEDLSTGFAWHARVHALSPDDVARARRVTIAEAREFRASPLVPESALVLAARLTRVLPERARVVVIDGSPALVDALVHRGHAVTVLIERASPDAFGAHENVTRRFELGAPLPDDLLACADLVIVDAFRREGMIVPLLCRALAITKATGHVSLLAHALWRDTVKTTLSLLPVREVARDDEVAARLITGARLADIFWDHVVLARTDGELPLSPSRALSARDLVDHDPESDRHGCVEVSGLVRPLAPHATDEVLARYSELLSVRVVGETRYEAGTVRHHHAVFSDGVTLVVLVDDDRGVFRADLTGWTPSLHVDLAAAVVTTLPRDDGTIRFNVRPREHADGG
jgi:hypothetical protein